MFYLMHNPGDNSGPRAIWHIFMGGISLCKRQKMLSSSRLHNITAQPTWLTCSACLDLVT